MIPHGLLRKEVFILPALNLDKRHNPPYLSKDAMLGDHSKLRNQQA
jgi:hypothetical protein